LSDSTEDLQAQVNQARSDGNALRIRGGDSKAFYGNPADGDFRILDTRCHNGVIDYAPEELMIRVRAGTPLEEVQQLLSDNGQMLPFEPPHFGGAATMGGVVASGISGPRRPYTGAVRDFVLGVTLITGQGKVLSFGGQVMKNVAGYDVSRLVVGAMGTLGVILDVSFKVLPRPEGEVTLKLPDDTAVDVYNDLLRRPCGLSAQASFDNGFFVRVSESAAVDGERTDDGLWQSIANQSLPLFQQVGQQGSDLWRISLPRLSAQYFDDAVVTEWGGAQRWLVDPAESPHDTVQNGHATLFRSNNAGMRHRFQPLAPQLAVLHRNIKKHFDPSAIFNPDRLNWYNDAD
jgi:glycolate oxidase FAD binding subunit